jgi:hypothetical protein
MFDEILRVLRRLEKPILVPIDSTQGCEPSGTQWLILGRLLGDSYPSS